MVFSPWYNYGMYSAVMKPDHNYVVTKVYADDELLTGSKFSPQTWDRIHYNLNLAVAVTCNEHFLRKRNKTDCAEIPCPGSREETLCKLQLCKQRDIPIKQKFARTTAKPRQH